MKIEEREKVAGRGGLVGVEAILREVGVAFGLVFCGMSISGGL